MSRDFHATFDPNQIVIDTMEDLINESLDALRSNFQGTGTASSSITSQFSSDTTAGRLKIRDQVTTTWHDVFDFSGQKVYIKPSQIGTTEISTAAKKPSIILGEDISPGTCTLRAEDAIPFGSIPMMPIELAGYFGDIGVSFSYSSIYTSKIYVPSEATSLHMMCYQKTCKAKFIVGTTSSTESTVTTGPSWGTEVTLNVASLSGWKDFKIQGYGTLGGITPPFGTITGISSRWGV